MASAVTTQNLSKRYLIRRETAAGSYLTLRDMLATEVRRLGGRFFGRGNTGAAADELWALRGLDIEISQGERIGIIGRNGSGKSTLLKLLSRVTAPTAGVATITGRIGSLLEVGTGFHPELTGRDNIFLNGAILGMRRGEVAAKLDEIVDFAGVERFLDTPVKHFSSGMAVRLAFSVAAHLEPEVLVIDEVLAVGDADFQNRCIERMRRLAGEGRTLLFVSHNLGTIGALCDRCIWLDKGQLKQFDRTAAVVAGYMRIEGHGHAVDIRPEQRVRGGGMLRFERARFSDVLGEPKTAFRIGEQIRLEIDVNSSFDDAVSFWVLIYDTYGRPLLSTYQRDVGTVRIAPGRFQLIYETSGLALMPGSYSVSAGAVDASLGLLEWVENFTSFEVQPAFRNGAAFDRRWGVIDQPATWQLNRIT